MTKKISLYSDVKNLHEAFSRAGDTGRKDDMKKATGKAKAFDNKYGTDYVGELSGHIGCGCSFLRKSAEFTKSNGLRENAQIAFLLVADNVNRIDVNAILEYGKTYHGSQQLDSIY